MTVTGATIISGWINSNTSLNKTFSNNTFDNWTGGSAALTVMNITAGKSSITANTISNMTTGNTAAAPIIAITSGTTDAISITNNTISNLVSGSDAFINSFTGITNNAGTDVTITGNTITGCTAGGTVASLFTGIAAITAGSGTLTITNNNIISGTNAGTGAFTAISNGAPFATVNINNNIIRNNSITSATGAFTAISNTGAVTTAINIINNQLGNTDGGLINYTTIANTATLTGINNTAGAASCALSIQNNNFLGIDYTVAGTNAHTYISNSAATLSQNISGNTFTNLSVNTTGAIIFISNSVIMPANGVQNVNSNSIATAFTRTATSGAITLFTSTAATNNTNVTVNNNSNNFSGITISGTATISGWVNTDAGLGNVTKTIDGNTFSNWSAGAGTGTITALDVNITSPNSATRNNNINTISSAGNISGITTGAGNDHIFSNTIHTLISTGGTTTVVNGIAITGGTVKNVYLNTIYNLQANNITTGSVSGIAVSGGATNNIYRNKIYEISSSSSGITGTVNGILVSGAIPDQITTIHNNRIGDLRVTAANTADAIRGISIANTGLRSVTNVYYNTVHLNATSSGALFGSSGIFHAASAGATTGALNLRNNIIVNISTPNGTGLTVAYRRSLGTANTLNNYVSTSNNNLFYAGVPGANNLIYSDGTGTAQTLAAYKAGTFTAGNIAPRDQASVTESPAFISTNGADADFLKINNSKVSFIESGAVNIAGITTDFEGDIRAGNPGYPAQTNGSGTAPDIGADEFDGRGPLVVVSNAHTNSNGAYGNLGEAFAAINAQTQAGNNILVSLIGSTTETSTALLNTGTWTSLRVFPAVDGVTISGNLFAPLIDLNGAGNVTIDGRVNQTGTTVSLSITNSSTSAIAGTSTIRFINSAQNNTLRYCFVNGSSLSVSDGIITFLTSASGNGNDNNLIEFCNITNAGGNRPVNAIYSEGTSGHENNTNTISNNNIFNFLNPGASSNGINIGAFSTDWSISANSFYETTSFVPTAGTFAYTAININNTSGNNFTVSGNYIGGQAASCGGGAWSVDAATNHSFRSVYLNVGESAVSSVQNNTIHNWNYRSGSATPWRAIEVNDGAVNIGTVTANIIGSNTGTGSITLTAAATANSFGIYIGSTGAVNVSRNQMGSFNIIGNNTDISHSFTAIYKSNVAGTLTIANNIIGSTTAANSIFASFTASTSAAAQHLRAIFTESNGTVTITQNTIANLSNAYTDNLSSNTRGIHTTAGASSITRNTVRLINSASLGASGSVIGIELSGTDGANTVSENIIYSLSNSNTTFPGYVAGIIFSGNTGANIVNGNFIHSLSVNASTSSASIYGIRIAAGATTYSNNIISLGGNTATTIYGIYETGGASNNNNLYFNTVYISGALSSGVTNKSYALFSNASTNTRNFRNNIFANFRSTTSGANLHYAAYFNYGANTNLTLDYNNYYSPGTGGVIGYFNGANVATIPIVPTQDDNSSAVDPQFVNAGGTAAVDYRLQAQLDGVTGTGIVLDYGLMARGSPPNMGAWEFNTNRWKGNISTDFATPANWTAGAVPLEGTSIVFAADPDRDCVLDMNRTVGDIVNDQAAYKLVVNGRQLTINGNLYFTNGAQIDATAATSTLIFAGNETQTIPDAAFVNNEIPNLTINNEYGVVSLSDLTTNGTLNLLSANPSATVGCLHTGARVITLGADAVTIGDGDVTGIVSRTAIVANRDYTFGNKNAKILFLAQGTLPTSISVRISIGAAPSWKTGAVQRFYDIIQTGANPLDPTAATITSAYLDSELNGNDEEKLVNWSYRFINSQLFEHGRASHNPFENWLKLTNVNMAFFPGNFNQVHIGIDESEIETLTWNGSVSTSWTTVNNWTPMGAPSDYVNIIIPNAATTAFDPILPPETTVKSIKLESGAILNATTNALATITGGVGAWVNEGGTFNAGTSTVVFTNEQATLSGATNFNNASVAEQP